MGFANDDELPDWLSDLGSGGLSAAPKPESEPVGEEPQEEQPDWMAARPPAAEPSIFGASDDEDDVPDWLATIRESEGRAPDELPSVFGGPPEPAAESEPADWFESIRTRESGSLPADEAPATEEDFMSRIESIKAAAPAEENASQDWLAGLASPAEPDKTDNIFGEGPDEAAAPDWMSGIQSSEEPPAVDKPDWLADVGSGIGMGLSAEGLPKEPAWMGEADAGEDAGAEAPAWAAEAGERASQAVSQEFPGLPDEPAPAAPPSWLTDIQPDDAPGDGAFSSGEYEEAASDVFKLDSGELPDWLAQISPEDALPAPPEPERGDSARAASPFDTDDLAPADLPSWLQAMRPVGPAGIEDLPEEERGEEERIGPLAGLAGVLPAEPEIVQFGRPPSATTGLQLNEAQRGYALQLAQMVEAEAQARPARRQALALPQRFARLGVALVLMLAVAVFTLYSESHFSNLPQAAGQFPPAEIQAVLSIVNQMSASDTVLVAVDYQPALSGELEAAAMGVVDHMILRGVRLVMLSTLPTGPGQTQHFMTGTQALNHADYQLNSSYYNLGYLSGGTAGLLQLASDPRSALPVRLEDGRDVWSEPALATRIRLRDFSAVLLLTDDADLARAWVEQVQPVLVDASTGRTTPLLVVTSAQAEPMLIPYLHNEPAQIQGLVAGLRGGAYYEANIRELNARRYWDAYSAGLSVGVGVLAVGAALGLGRNLLGGRRKASGGRA